MSPQIIQHSMGAQTSTLAWDSDLIAQSPYVMGLSGYVLKTVVDTYSELSGLSGLLKDDLVLVWGADSSETMVYTYDGSAFESEGSGSVPDSGVLYLRKDTKETMSFYSVVGSTNYYNLECAGESDGRNTLSILCLLPNVYLLGTVQGYYATNCTSINRKILFTNSTSRAISGVEVTTTATTYTIPCKCNGITLHNSKNGSGYQSVFCGFTAA